MRLIPLALAAVSAAAIGSASPAMAQPAKNDMNDAGYNTHSQMDEQSSDNNSDYGWHGSSGCGEDQDHSWGGYGGAHEHGMRRHGPGRMMGGGPGWMGRGGGMQTLSRPRGARFLLQNGNSRVDIRCPARQSLGDCVDAADKLLNRLTALKRAAGPSTPAQPGKPAGTNGSLPGTPGAPGTTITPGGTTNQ